MKNIFIDGIGATQLVAGTVRLELVTLAADGTGGKPAPEQTGERLVMSLEGFIRMHGQMGEVVEQLVSRGVLQRRASASGSGNPVAPSGAAGGTKAS